MNTGNAIRGARLCMMFALLVNLFSGGLAYSQDIKKEDMRTIQGEIWYRERMLLPPDAELIVSLEDVAKMDVASETIDRIQLPVEGGPPFAFKLDFEPAKLHDRGRYALRARIENQGRLMFISTQNIPAFDRPPGAMVKIGVSRVVDKQPLSRESAFKPDASLSNTYWKLTQLNGQVATLGAGEREVQMVFTDEGRVRGYSGCNRFSGSYQSQADKLSFSPAMSTRMACVEGMGQEARFLAAFNEVVRFEIQGEVLTLFNSAGKQIMNFESVYLQ